MLETILAAIESQGLLSELELRFWSKVEVTQSCWIWTACRDHNGYGIFEIRKPVAVKAHRLAWTLRRGKIPKGLLVLHNCPGGDNPSCVNPAHLWLGTNADNTHDRDAKGRTSKGEFHYKHRLTASDVLAIRQRLSMLSSGTTPAMQIIAGEYGVSMAAIQHIFYRRSWKSI